MAWNNADELVVGNTGQVYVAAVGTALPANESSALNSAFKGLGYITEDGVTINVEPDITEFNAWQSRSPIRRELNMQGVTATFGLTQWDEDTVPLAFGGGTITDLGSGHYKYELPDDEDALDERAAVIDVQDGSEIHRFVIPRCNVSEAVEVQFQRTEMAILPITLSALEPTGGGSPMHWLSNSAAFAAGS